MADYNMHPTVFVGSEAVVAPATDELGQEHPLVFRAHSASSGGTISVSLASGFSASLAAAENF